MKSMKCCKPDWSVCLALTPPHLWVDEEVAEGEVVDAEAARPGQAVGVRLHQRDQLAQHDPVRENVGLKTQI